MKVLDLFCKAGGAAMGLHWAWPHAEITGVDIAPQPRYPFTFVQADAMTYPLDGFDFVWASPPCQRYSTLRHLHPSRDYPDLIEPIRQRLIRWGGTYTIENVPGAPLLNPTLLCGSAFNLKVRRHRRFETNWYWWNPKICHHGRQGRPIDVSGTGSRRVNARADGGGGDSYKPLNLKEAQAAMGIDWMNREELAEAIPPAYSEFIAKQFIEASK